VDPVLELTGLTQRFGDKTVLNGLDLAVGRGEIVGYLGPNGAGKSTTMSILTGQRRPTSGTARVLGIDVAAQPLEVRRRIAFVPEVSPLYEVLTARETLELVGRLRSLPAAAVHHRAEELLAALELGDVMDRPLWSFSRGMKQRVALASAFLHDPELVLLDEPLYGLDVQTVMLVKDVVRELAARGITVLYCSHLLEVVEQLATRVVILARGEIVADGPPGLLRERRGDATLETLFRELTSDQDVAGRARRFLGAGPAQPPPPRTPP